MTLTLILQIVESLAAALGQIAPLFAQGNAVLGESDAAQIHAALTKAEGATATLRGQVDAALAAAAKS